MENYECTNTAGVIVNKSADWTCYHLPTTVSSNTAYTFAAFALELAACPFEETICGATREFSYDTIGSTSTVTISKLAAGVQLRRQGYQGCSKLRNWSYHHC